MCAITRRSVVKKAILFATLGVLLIVYFFPKAGYYFRGVNPQVNSQNYQRIQPGMSVTQVCHILGPPQNETYHLHSKHVLWARWRGPNTEVFAVFDEDGKVSQTECDGWSYEESTFATFLRSCGIYDANDKSPRYPAGNGPD